MHQVLTFVVRPFTWAAQRRDWWDELPAFARWAKEEDRRFAGSLMFGCAVIGIGGAVMFPYSPAIVGASWFGMLFAFGLFPTKRRGVLAVVLALACLWPLFPHLFLGRECLVWPLDCVPAKPA